jgi:alpha-glucosidase
MYVDEETMNVLGKRRHGRRHDELIARVFAAEQSRFRLYEDDGETVAYLKGAVRTTSITQRRDGDRTAIVIRPARGTYRRAPRELDNVIELALCGAVARDVALNGVPLARRTSLAEFQTHGRGWYDGGDGLVRMRSGRTSVARAKRFVVRQAAR